MEKHGLAALCRIVLFGYSVSQILSSEHFSQVPRNLDIVEVFTEAKSIVQAATAARLQAESFDWKNDGQESVLGLGGFVQVVELTMRVKPGGLVAIAPDCSSFGFGPSSLTGRKKGNFEGDTSKEVVCKGNKMALTAMFLFFLALARGCHAILENPSGSMLFSFLQEPISALFNAHTGLRWCYLDRCAYTTTRPTWKKHFKFLCDGAWFQRAVRTCSCPPGGHIPLMDTKSKDGKVQKNGRCKDGEMKQSGLYPFGLGVQIIDAWMKAGQANEASLQNLQLGRKGAKEKAAKNPGKKRAEKSPAKSVQKLLKRPAGKKAARKPEEPESSSALDFVEGFGDPWAAAEDQTVAATSSSMLPDPWQ
eukprot:s1605_g6.t1